MHYQLGLFEVFNENHKTETSIEELAQIWQCSTRYAKTIIKKLHEQKIVKWETAKGRGKKPFITLVQSREACIIELFTTYWDKHQFEEAYSLIGEYGMLSHPTIQKWLQQQYGVQENEQSQHILQLPYHQQYIELNPLQAQTNWDAHIIQQIHEPLFKENEQSGEIESNLLFSFETEDYQQWRFILRKGVYFHHLKPIQAIDVQFSLERLVALAKPYFDYEKLDIVNDYEICLTLSKPIAILPRLLATFRTVILPKEKPDGTIGCGAFMLASYSSYKIQLTTFDQYFNKRPFIDGIEFILDKSETNYAISKAPFPKNIPQKELQIKQPGTDYIVLNTQNGSLQNRTLRENILGIIELSSQYSSTLNKLIIKEPNKRHTLLANISQIVDEFSILKIGYQYLSLQSNYLSKAELLQKHLNHFGIKTELICVDITKIKVINTSIDIYIGGAVFGKDKILSVLNTFFTEPQVILNFLNEMQRNEVLQLIDKICAMNQRTEETALNELILNIQKFNFLKFMPHEPRTIYIRDDDYYKNLKFDHDGFIQYNTIFYEQKSKKKLDTR